MNIMDTLLRKYDTTSHVVRLKARFLLFVYAALILSLIFIIGYTAYLQPDNPSYGYAVHPGLLGLSIGALFLIISCAVILMRGHFALAAHGTVMVLFLTIWTAMVIDCSVAVSRLDTIVLVLAVLASTPLFTSRSRIAVPLYAGVNLALLYAFMFYFRADMDLAPAVFPEYLAENTVAFFFTGFISYNIFSINNRALDQLSLSNKKLKRANMELRSTMEELEETYEKFEAQNEELVHSEEALRESLVEKTALLKEVHHRVKNNMQIISSLLNMQAGVVSEPASHKSLLDAVGRIQSMAGIHEKIYRADNFSRVDMASYIEDLSRDLVALYGADNGAPRITCRLDPVYLTVQQAVPCGLLINELLSNAIKHGRRESEPCNIELVMERADGRIILVIADRGPGMNRDLFESEKKQSMGMQIIDVLARQIGATLALDVSEGTRVTIQFAGEDRDARGAATIPAQDEVLAAGTLSIDGA